MGLTINAIVLGVQDLKRSKQFYGDGLGLAIEQEQGPDVATGREGTINQITMRQRQPYDRASFDLLRTPVLLIG
jgi:catechol-2,3-dioxygenase